MTTMKTSDWIAAAGVIVAFFGVVISSIIAVLAIWGERIRSRFPPELIIEQIGLRDPVDQTDRDGKVVRRARYYHLCVKNVRPRRFPAAHEAEVLVTRVEEPGAEGQPTKIVFPETVPVTWVRGEVYPLRRTIGPDAEANLFQVGEDGGFEFELVVRPNHFPKPVKAPVKYWVTVQVRSTEAESKSVRYRIEWNGQWREQGEIVAVSPDPPLQ
jgi:hypothetical protein